MSSASLCPKFDIKDKQTLSHDRGCAVEIGWGNVQTCMNVLHSDTSYIIPLLTVLFMRANPSSMCHSCLTTSHENVHDCLVRVNIDTNSIHNSVI